jgi:hypothetical protein
MSKGRDRKRKRGPNPPLSPLPYPSVNPLHLLMDEMSNPVTEGRHLWCKAWELPKEEEDE